MLNFTELKIRMNKIIAPLTLLLLVSIIFPSCDEEYTPKPKAYFRIDFPEKKYQLYTSDCGFNFEYPEYAEIQTEKIQNSEECWLNVNYPTFNGTLHLSYKRVNNNLRELTEDSRTLALKHAVRAQEISEEPFVNGNKVYGLKYEIKGDVASSIQFYLTDSLKHFMRVSLYFNVQPNADSLAPVLAFIQYDVQRMMASFNFEQTQ